MRRSAQHSAKCSVQAGPSVFSPCAVPCYLYIFTSQWPRYPVWFIMIWKLLPRISSHNMEIPVAVHLISILNLDNYGKDISCVSNQISLLILVVTACKLSMTPSFPAPGDLEAPTSPGGLVPASLSVVDVLRGACLIWTKVIPQIVSLCQ